jgi:hypothetical protein
VIAISLAMLIVAAGCSREDAAFSAASLQQAEDSYMKLDLRAAREQLQGVLDSESSSDDDRAEAARFLANIAWRIDLDGRAARELLERAAAFGLEEVDLSLERARCLLSERDFGGAREMARRALAAASTREEVTRSIVAYGGTVLEEALEIGLGPAWTEQVGDRVRRALDLLMPALEAEPGHLDLSRLTLGLGLLARDGPAALAGWRSYFWISDGSPPGPILAGAEAVLSGELPEWRGLPLPGSRRAAVSGALADSGFFRLAAAVAKDGRRRSTAIPAGIDRVEEILAYARFLDELEAAARESYRLNALGRRPDPDLRSELRHLGGRLWNDLPWQGGAPRFTERSFLREIRKRFGTVALLSRHHGVDCIHLAHRTVDRRESIRQYSREADLRFMVLDSVVTNGYDSWLWDGRAGTGGWVTDEGVIIQIRPVYAGSPLDAWRRLTDPDEREKHQEEIDRKTLRDDLIARGNPHAYLPGLGLRLKQQAHEGILESLRAAGIEKAAMRTAFIREVDRRVRASSITAHEGRHAIDRLGLFNKFRSDAEKEFRAKLSEVALAPDPRLALTGGILIGNIGGDSAHGQANERIMKILVAWMRANQNRIAGFDPSRPRLPQLDLLSDDQLRQAIRESDPMARGSI